MKIIADDNIPNLDDLFSGIGEIIKVPGREINNQIVQNADILLVRSVTRVDEKLIKGSRIKFVGTCTIGFDHIDLDYLLENKIIFAYSPGCNKQAVVDWVMANLFLASLKFQESLKEKKYLL